MGDPTTAAFYSSSTYRRAHELNPVSNLHGFDTATEGTLAFYEFHMDQPSPPGVAYRRLGEDDTTASPSLALDMARAAHSAALHNWRITTLMADSWVSTSVSNLEYTAEYVTQALEAAERDGRPVSNYYRGVDGRRRQLHVWEHTHPPPATPPPPSNASMSWQRYIAGALHGVALSDVEAVVDADRVYARVSTAGSLQMRHLLYDVANATFIESVREASGENAVVDSGPVAKHYDRQMGM